MTKKDDTTSENTLEKKLEEIQEEKQNQEESEKNEEITKLQNKIAQLEKEKLEGQEITKKAQYDYINLKADFDRFQRQTAEATKSNEKDALIKSVKKLLPFVEELRKSLDHITADKQSDPFFQGIKIVYDKLLKTLESLNIKPIQSIGLIPDSLFHEPLGMKPTEDTSLKGKIIEEYERGFYYEKDGEKTVITPSKVIIGG